MQLTGEVKANQNGRPSQNACQDDVLPVPPDIGLKAPTQSSCRVLDLPGPLLSIVAGWV